MREKRDTYLVRNEFLMTVDIMSVISFNLLYFTY